MTLVTNVPFKLIRAARRDLQMVAMTVVAATAPHPPERQMLAARIIAAVSETEKTRKNNPARDQALAVVVAWWRLADELSKAVKGEAPELAVLIDAALRRQYWVGRISDELNEKQLEDGA